jgi:hypothetical protein
MQISQAVSHNVGNFHAVGGQEAEAYQALIINITACHFFLLLACLLYTQGSAYSVAAQGAVLRATFYC